MLLFPYFWLAGAAVAAVCIWLGAGEVLLLQWAAVCLYLLSFLRWHRNGAVYASTVDPDEEIAALRALEISNDPTAGPAQPLLMVEEDPRFGGRGPDDLQQHLLQHCAQLEARMRRLQVNTL